MIEIDVWYDPEHDDIVVTAPGHKKTFAAHHGFEPWGEAIDHAAKVAKTYRKNIARGVDVQILLHGDTR
jgi:hypothetical protein